MRNLSLRTALVALALLVPLGLPEAPAVAEPGPDVTFLLHNVPGHHEGTWTTAGAFGANSGTWGVVGDFCAGGRSSATFTCHFPDLILTAADGALHLSANSQFDRIPGTHGCEFTESGTWQITSATGVFTGDQARGTIAATLDFCSTALTTLDLSGNALPAW